MGSDFTVNFNEYMPLRDLVFTTLRQAILKGELQPGERLMEIQLADKMGVSRTPIREAIRKLEKEGLVLMIPRKGAEVAGISEKMLKDVLEVRMTLEKLAFTLSMTRISEAGIEKLESVGRKFVKAVSNDNIVDMAAADEEFHFVIYDAADNDKLKELLFNLKENMYRYRMEYLKDENYRKDLIDEHEKMIKYFKTKNLEDGLVLVEKHIANQEKAVLNKLRQEESDNKSKGKDKKNIK